ncbi:MAG: diguanylate cyclase [Pseudomonadota bacterium]
MSAHILIVDQVAVNRIVLKVKLSTAHYHVTMAQCEADALKIIRRAPPDLVIADITPPSLDGLKLCRNLKAREDTKFIPVLLTGVSTDPATMLAALAAGAEEFLAKPLDDVRLLARVRAALRARHAMEDLVLKDSAHRAIGLSEERLALGPPARIAVLTSSKRAVPSALPTLQKDPTLNVAALTLAEVHSDAAQNPAPDVFVFPASLSSAQDGLQLITDLRSQSATQSAGILIVTPKDSAKLSAQALDYGANDIIHEGHTADELRLRVGRLVARKQLADALRNRVKDGLKAAVIDPLTGLYNRRYAMPRLKSIAEEAARTKQAFAVMLVDLDRFKQVNDQYGHAAGDAVLVEVARRLSVNLRSVDLIARIGGEEFLVVMPRTSLSEAEDAAQRLRRAVCETPFALPDGRQSIQVSISIGVALSEQNAGLTAPTDVLMSLADKALYGAKSDGRNQVFIGNAAA